MYSIELTGSPYDRGLQQGKEFSALLPDAIRLCTEEYKRDIPGSVISEIKEKLMDETARICPQLLEEMEGISKGSGIPIEDIIDYNFFWDLYCAGRGCTSIGMADSTGRIVIGKTSDLGDEWKYYVVKYVKPSDGNSYISVGMIGAVWSEVGINNKYLVVTQNSAPYSLRQRDGAGIPSLFLPGLLLERCNNRNEAVRFIMQTSCIGTGLNMVISDRSSEPVAAEKSFDRTSIREAAGNMVFCTNHFISSEMNEFRLLPIDGLFENSTGRYETLLTAAANAGEKDSIDFMKGILSLHSQSGSICQHNTLKGLETMYSYIIVPDEKQFLITDGKACETGFVNVFKVAL